MFQHFAIPVLINGKDSTEFEKYAYVDLAVSVGYTPPGKGEMSYICSAAGLP